jgi:hypothetical protein
MLGSRWLRFGMDHTGAQACTRESLLARDRLGSHGATVAADFSLTAPNPYHRFNTGVRAFDFCPERLDV